MAFFHLVRLLLQQLSPALQPPPDVSYGFSSSQVLLTWQDNSENEENFKIGKDEAAGFEE